MSSHRVGNGPGGAAGWTAKAVDLERRGRPGNVESRTGNRASSRETAAAGLPNPKIGCGGTLLHEIAGLDR